MKQHYKTQSLSGSSITLDSDTFIEPTTPPFMTGNGRFLERCQNMHQKEYQTLVGCYAVWVEKRATSRLSNLRDIYRRTRKLLRRWLRLTAVFVKRYDPSRMWRKFSVTYLGYQRMSWEDFKKFDRRGKDRRTK